MKTIIIANAAISDTDSNGRTLKRLLDCLEKDEKAEFYTYGFPDLDACSSFYKVTDRDALRAVLPWMCKDGKVERLESQNDNGSAEKPSMKKTPFVMICREIIWEFSCWKNAFLKRWINTVNPDCIFLYLGDNWFTIDFAISIAKKRNLPIIVYSTEEYPFKNYNYVTKKKSLFYDLWLWRLKRSYTMLNSYVKVGLFNSEELTKLYANCYQYRCKTLYQSSNIEWMENVELGRVVSYLGNLRLNRHKALIEIAEALHDIDPSLRLDIYGNASDEVKLDFSAYSNIRLCGFISYENVVKVIHSSSLLIHAEYSDDFYNRDLRYAFSTKITDSVCSGTPLLVYADAGMSLMKFLSREGCAFTATSKDELKETMRKALSDANERKKVLERAFYVRKKYFTGSGRIRQVIEECLDESITG